jgi:Down syndrome cell adhesion protein 1
LPQIVPFSFGDETINLDDSLSVTCISNKGNLPLEIQWYFRGEDNIERRLYTNDGIVISRAGNRMSSLAIESVKRRNSGSYSCIAKNSAGQTNFTTTLTIKGTSYLID